MKFTLILLSLSLVLGRPLYQRSQAPSTSQLLWEYERPSDASLGRVSALSANPTGSQIALGYDGSEHIDILDTRTGQLEQTLTSPVPLDIDDLVWSPSCHQLAVASYYNLVLVWDLNTGAAPTLKEKLPDVVSPRISWSAQDVLAVVSPLDIDGELRILDGSTRQLMIAQMINGLNFPVWSADGRYLALYRYNQLGDENNFAISFIDVWDYQTHSMIPVQLPTEIDQEKYEFKNFVWLPYSAGLLGSAGGYLWRWTLLTGKSAMIARLYTPDPNGLSGDIDLPISLNDRGDIVAVDMNGAGESQIDFVDPANGKQLLRLRDMNTLTDFTWGPNNTFYVAHGVVSAYQITMP